ncbi:MAG TPA: ZIP family metal transporter [Candidatus Saccharimonadales bacterium]|nr:ZIP family metal transporter [Candidatus Saccharimonadales bacterium]
MVALIALITASATLLGGLFALKYRDKLHLILAYSAGAVIGVAFFDLLPESFDLAAGRFGALTVTSLVALGFIIYTVLSHALAFHVHADEDGEHNHAEGELGAGSLSIHSFLDGLGIGLAFKVSPAIGIVIALGVIAHDFSDGLNTVTMILKDNGNRIQALRWLLVDAAAPIIGIIVASFVHVSDSTLGLVLAVFAGFFFFIGASDLLPESRHHHPKFWTVLLTVAGMATIYLAIRLANF